MLRSALLVSFACLLGCGSSNVQQNRPTAPGNVRAHAGDGQVTVLWDAVTDAVSYRVYSAEGAVTASSTHVDVGNVTTWTVVGLTNGHAYNFAVSAVGTGGESDLSSSASATPAANVALGVASVTPADQATSVARNAQVVVRFNRAAKNVSAACNGTLQISDDNFATCAAGAVASSDAGATWTFTPSAPLHGSATYKVRVTTGVTDANGVALGAAYNASFTTAPALAVNSITQSGGLRPTITVAFNRAINPASLTDCGSFQLTAGASCVATTHTLSGNTATFTPGADLTANTAYTVTITTQLQDSDGVPLAAPATQGFTTSALLTITNIAPADGAVNLSTSTQLSVTFDRPPDPATVAFQLTAGGAAVPVGDLTASVDGKTFTASPVLQQSTVYDFKVDNVRDPSGLGLAAPGETHFITGPALSVTAVTPADAATNVARNATVQITFNKAPGALTANADCSGDVQLSADNFATCVTGAFSGTTFTPATLAGATTYKLRIAGVKDANGVPMPAPWTSSFTTKPALAVTAFAPPDGATGVATNAVVSVTFNAAAANVTLQLCATTCADTGATASNAGMTWSAAPTLQASTTYHLKVLAAAQDSDGVALGADVVQPNGFTTGATADTTPPGEVTNPQVSADFQHLFVSWTNPTDADFASVRVYVAQSGSAGFPSEYVESSGTSLTVGPLTPGKTWDVQLRTVDAAGNESAGTVVANVAAGFAGTTAEWVDGETVAGIKGGKFSFTWSDTEFFAAYQAALNAANGDAIWIAFDTGDGGETISTTGATQNGITPKIVWPFAADYVVELKNVAGGPVANLRTVATNSWAPLTASKTLTSAISELRFAQSAIGNPAQVSVAFAAIATHSSDTQLAYTYDGAPLPPPGDVPTFAQYASLTAYLDTATASDPTAFATSLADAPIVQALSLVQLGVTGLTTANKVKIAGSLLPLSYDLGLADYQLPSDGAGGYLGNFNFGGVAGELFFQFSNGGTNEFSPGTDRVFTLDGTTESAPQVTWNVAWSATHSFSLTFTVDSGTAVTEILGEPVELGNWTVGSGAQIVNDTTPFTTGPVDFGAHDFTVSPLQFKAYPWENDPNHTMNDDVLNTRELRWTYNAPASF